MSSDDETENDWKLSLDWDEWEASKRPPLTGDGWQRTMKDIYEVVKYYDPDHKRLDPLPGQVTYIDNLYNPKHAFTAKLRLLGAYKDGCGFGSTVEEALRKLLRDLEGSKAASERFKAREAAKAEAGKIDKSETQSAEKS